MTPKQKQDILSRAMLANVRISTWQARKHDREVTAKATSDAGASADAGRFHKRLFPHGCPELSALNTAASYLRWEHYAQTLPWSDDGWRILPTINHMAYCAVMRQRIATVEERLDDFLKVYEVRVEAQKEKAALGGMWKAADYPAAKLIRSKYAFDLDFMPIPISDDIRVNLPAAELKRLEKHVEDRVNGAVASAMADAWARLGDEVVELREKLGPGLREAAIERIREKAELLGKLNLTGDEQLDIARARVLSELGTLDAKAVRGDDAKLKAATAAADAILKSMKGMYTPAPKGT